jgi:hypothetical protein
MARRDWRHMAIRSRCSNCETERAVGPVMVHDGFAYVCEDCGWWGFNPCRMDSPPVQERTALRTGTNRRLGPADQNNRFRTRDRANRTRPHRRGEGAYDTMGPLAFRSCETAVKSCAGANGLVRRTLLGTPCAAHSAALSPVI